LYQQAGQIEENRVQTLADRRYFNSGKSGLVCVVSGRLCLQLLHSLMHSHILEGLSNPLHS